MIHTSGVGTSGLYQFPEDETPPDGAVGKKSEDSQNSGEVADMATADQNESANVAGGDETDARSDVTSNTKGLEDLPDRGNPFPGDLEKYRDKSFGNLSPMERIAAHLSPRDLLNAMQANRTWKEKFQRTGRRFMDPVYKSPETTLPELLGKHSEPSSEAGLVHNMAGLDPETELKTSLGKGSTAGRKFAQGGGYFASHFTPGQTPAEANAKYEEALARWSKRKEQGLPVSKKPPKEKPPTKAKESGYNFEYHPGGGRHSGGIPSSSAMGGAYFKVDQPARKNENDQNDSYRISRYGPFKSDERTGHIWDPIPLKGTEGKHKDLTPQQLIAKGSQAEKEGDYAAAAEYRREVEQRVKQKRSPSE